MIWPARRRHDHPQERSGPGVGPGRERHRDRGREHACLRRRQRRRAMLGLQLRRPARRRVRLECHADACSFPVRQARAACAYASRSDFSRPQRDTESCLMVSAAAGTLAATALAHGASASPLAISMSGLGATGGMVTGMGLGMVLDSAGESRGHALRRSPQSRRRRWPCSTGDRCRPSIDRWHTAWRSCRWRLGPSGGRIDQKRPSWACRKMTKLDSRR